MWINYDDEHLKPPVTRHIWVLYVIVIAIGVGIAWAMTFKVDQVVRGQGKVIASSKVQVVQSLDGGIIRDILVREGDIVEKGQIVAELDEARTEAAVKELEARVGALRARAARLEAQATYKSRVNYPASIKNLHRVIKAENALFRQNINGQSELVRDLKHAIALAQEDYNLVYNLSKSGDVSQSEVIRAKRALNDAKSKLTTARNDYLQEARDKRASTQDEIGQNEQILEQRKRQLIDSDLRSSVKGIVKNVSINTKGGVLRSGESLMEIVPLEETLIVEAKVDPSDIAWLRKELPVGIRLDAFDYTVFGALDGKVVYISADTLEEDTQQGKKNFYRVHVATDGATVTRAGHHLDILPGMTAQVDIKTGTRTVMDYLLKPLRKTLTLAFGER